VAETTSIPYDEFFALCGKAYQRYGSIFELPVAEDPYAYLRRIYTSQYASKRVLDFGGGTRKPLQEALGISDVLYHSCDSDPSGEFTYRSPDEIPADIQYDVIAANQVFEHLPFDIGVRAAVTLAKHVAPGGVMQIGVPNPAHPTRFLSNPTHCTPWNYFNLYALLELGDLDPFFIARCNKTPGPCWFERPFINMIGRIYRMDWCDTVYAVGRKEESRA